MHRRDYSNKLIGFMISNILIMVFASRHPSTIHFIKLNVVVPGRIYIIKDQFAPIQTQMRVKMSWVYRNQGDKCHRPIYTFAERHSYFLNW
jgi:hypothetical protein